MEELYPLDDDGERSFLKIQQDGKIVNYKEFKKKDISTYEFYDSKGLKERKQEKRNSKPVDELGSYQKEASEKIQRVFELMPLT